MKPMKAMENKKTTPMKMMKKKRAAKAMKCKPVKGLPKSIIDIESKIYAHCGRVGIQSMWENAKWSIYPHILSPSEQTALKRFMAA